MSFESGLRHCKVEMLESSLPELVALQSKPIIEHNNDFVYEVSYNNEEVDSGDNFNSSSTDADSDSEGFSSGGEEKVRARGKRKQVKQACINCRSAHAGCEDQRPCSRCIRLGRQNSCQDAPRKKRSCQRKPDLIIDQIPSEPSSSPDNNPFEATIPSPTLKWEALPKKRVNLKQKHKKSADKKMKFYTSVLQPVPPLPESNPTVRIPSPFNTEHPLPSYDNPPALPTMNSLQPLLLHPDVISRTSQALPPLSHNYPHPNFPYPTSFHAVQGIPYTSTSGSYIIKEVPVTHTVVYRTIIHQPLPQITHITKDLPRSAFNTYEHNNNNITSGDGRHDQQVPIVIPNETPKFFTSPSVSSRGFSGNPGFIPQVQHLPYPVNGVKQQYQQVAYSLNGHR
eukprot:TRINITY_DN22843_c0_g1_i1.p1 TRINITY_DN22843_c0_g1~~TRINITY_DN22843_c0_g1_i1.p1  ORF type:complete len:396 (-),score=60.10 TRINITY_DN22843_c0_g1_i1:294-1481(-)